MKTNNLWKVLIPLVILFGICSIQKGNLNEAAPVQPNNNLISPSSLERSIIKGVHFLEENQLPNGEFPVYSADCPNKIIEDYKNQSYRNEIFQTPCVIYSLQFIENLPAVTTMSDKVVNYLLEQKDPSGLWRTYTLYRDPIYHNGKEYSATRVSLVPELDTTAMASFILKINNALPEEDFNKEEFFINKNEEGLFYLWRMDIPPHREGEENFPDYTPSENHICPGVNSNILLYLGDREETSGVSNWLTEMANEKTGDYFEEIPWYDNDYLFYYLYSRAFFKGANSLIGGKEAIIEKLKPLQREDGSFGTHYDTALAACSLMNFDYYGNETKSAVEYLYNNQHAEGSWTSAIIYADMMGNYLGSSYISTAIALEAISRFKENSVVIEATTGEGGSIKPYGELTFPEGTDQTFTITADGNYKIADVLINGESIGKVNGYTFEAIDKNHTIHAIFELKTNPFIYVGIAIATSGLLMAIIFFVRRRLN